MDYKDFSPNTLAATAKCCVSRRCSDCPLAMEALAHVDDDIHCETFMDPIIRKIGETILSGSYDDNVTAQNVVIKSINQVYLEFLDV